MRKFATLLALAALAFGIQPALAATPQQEKMSTCNATAAEKALKGDARKAFMKDCLSAEPANKQQVKMKQCNADAATRQLKGDARQQFMKQCLSTQAVAKPAAAPATKPAAKPST